jgi:four helix bundle protein
MPTLPMVVKSYRDLIAWQKAIDLVTEIYRCTQSFPKPETYGLIAQLRRAAVSVPSNIAEGHARLTTQEFRYSLGHALGSLAEIETQIIVSQRLEYMDSDGSTRLLERTAEVGKIMHGLLRSLGSGL